MAAVRPHAGAECPAAVHSSSSRANADASPPAGDILSLAVALSRRREAATADEPHHGAEEGGTQQQDQGAVVDLDMLLSQMKTFFAAGTVLKGFRV